MIGVSWWALSLDEGQPVILLCVFLRRIRTQNPTQSFFLCTRISSERSCSCSCGCLARRGSKTSGSCVALPYSLRANDSANVALAVASKPEHQVHAWHCDIRCERMINLIVILSVFMHLACHDVWVSDRERESVCVCVCVYVCL